MKLCRKYIIQKADGSDFDPNAKYFVLRYDAEAEHGYINRTILHKWCDYIRRYGLVELADDLLKDIREETNKAFGKDKTESKKPFQMKRGGIKFDNLGEGND